MDKKAVIVLAIILLIPLIALVVTVNESAGNKEMEKILDNIAIVTYDNTKDEERLLLSRNTSSESTIISLYPAEYRITMETFVPEATASASVKYQELLKNETDKFGNVYRVYGGRKYISRYSFETGCEGKSYVTHPWCWYEGEYTPVNIGSVDKFSNLNTTFVVPENSLNATLIVNVNGGTVLVNVYVK